MKKISVLFPVLTPKRGSMIQRLFLMFVICISLSGCNSPKKPVQVFTEHQKDSIFDYYIDAALYDSAKVMTNQTIRENIGQINQSLFLRYSFVTSMCGFPDYREKTLRENNEEVFQLLSKNYEMLKEWYRNDSVGENIWFNKLKFDCNADSIKVITNEEMKQKMGMYCLKFHNHTFYLIGSNLSNGKPESYRLQVPDLNNQGVVRLDWSIAKRRYEIIE